MSKVKFCEYCGKKLENGVTCDCPEAVQKENNWMDFLKSKFNSKLLIIPVAFIVVLALLLVLLPSKTEKVNLAQYVEETPDIKGLNGHASIGITDLFDGSSFEYGLLEMIEDKHMKDIDKMSEKEFERAFEKNSKRIEACEKAVEDIVITTWKNGDEVTELVELTNGDKIKIKVESAVPKNKFLKMKFKPVTWEFTVENLAEGQAIDVFEKSNLEVSFVGVNGNAGASTKYEANTLPDLSFFISLAENRNDLKNGDKVEVILDYDTEEWAAKGYYPLETSKTFIVEGLGTYLSSPDEISTVQLDEMKSTVEREIYNAAEDWRDGISIENISYVGNYYMTKKENDSTQRTQNFLYLVFKVDVFENFAPKGGEDNRFSFYYYGEYGSLILDQNGNIDYNKMSFNVPWKSFMRSVKMGNSILWGSVLVDYTGFETLDSLKAYCVESNSDKYTYTTDIK